MQQHKLVMFLLLLLITLRIYLSNVRTIVKTYESSCRSIREQHAFLYTINDTDTVILLEKDDTKEGKLLTMVPEEDVSITPDIELSTTYDNSAEVNSEFSDDSTESPTLDYTEKPLPTKLLKTIIRNVSDWYYGPSRFVQYMNTKYRQIQQKKVSNPKKRIVYEKKGTTGMAGQMFGVCDTLLLGVLHDRAVQFFAPALREEMFALPLSNFTFQVKIPQSANPYGYTPDLKPSFSHVIDYHWSRQFPGIHSDVDFNKEYPKSLLVISLHPFAEEVFQLNSTQRKLMSVGLARNTSTLFPSLSWYRICLNNLFKPSQQMMEYLQPYLEAFKGRYVIGMHARMGSGTATWHDNNKFLKITMVTSKILEIKRKMRWRKGSVFFLSTDSDRVEKYFKKRFNGAVITVDSFPRMHVGKKGVNEVAIIRSYMDIYLLGQCNFLYLTPGSGFSTAGLAINTKKPKFVYI